jgi:hypothetical protein
VCHSIAQACLPIDFNKKVLALTLENHGFDECEFLEPISGISSKQPIIPFVDVHD